MEIFHNGKLTHMSKESFLLAVSEYFDKAMITVPDDVLADADALQVYDRAYHIAVLDVIRVLQEALGKDVYIL